MMGFEEQIGKDEQENIPGGQAAWDFMEATLRL